ncbi:MAG: hypothetical protein PHD06_04350 [Bacteroidales bacterium]|jgi:hypothetical protein|nr:hypothetical protein [Bacteroidales bacterium]MDY0197760.1 hypothetical protein [Tenuifilaceae bacterium]
MVRGVRRGSAGCYAIGFPFFIAQYIVLYYSNVLIEMESSTLIYIADAIADKYI